MREGCRSLKKKRQIDGNGAGFRGGSYDSDICIWGPSRKTTL